MSVDELRLIKHGLEGPFGKWLLAELKTRRDNYRDQTLSAIPQSIGDFVEREQYLGRVNEISDLIGDIPRVISEQLKQAEEDETAKST